MTSHVSSKMFLAGLQWLFFMLANTAVIPLSIGAAFDLSQAEIASSLQRSFIYTGFACILQAIAGHRYPLMEGQSGLWWGVILSLSASASSAQMSLGMLGGGISLGIILSGILITISGACGLGKLLNKLFTPVVMSVVLFLLSSQLILIFFKGMIGLAEGSQVDLPVAGLSVLLVIFVSWLNIRGRGMVSNFSILIGIGVGWAAYALLFGQEDPIKTSGIPSLSFFPWGEPNVQAGIMITVMLTGLINTTNTVAAIKGVEPLFGKPTEDIQYRRSFILTGLNSIVSGIFGLVPYAPYISSIGFLQSTRILEVEVGNVDFCPTNVKMT